MSHDSSLAAANSPSKLLFPKQSRLVTKADFDRVYKQRCKAGDGVLLVFGAPNDLGRTRLGLSVSRKVGNAVVRNRQKRLLREAFRLGQHQLPRGIDLIVIPTAPERASLEVYGQSLGRLAAKLARRIAKSSESGAPL
ncbi:MAG: ribonuclease P protein component [Planctomycetales bacterium 12-60-4]|nr:MAG: ribonuclease P protein component [Planctomycetales bacterium 12-60-4]